MVRLDYDQVWGLKSLILFIRYIVRIQQLTPKKQIKAPDKIMNSTTTILCQLDMQLRRKMNRKKKATAYKYGFVSISQNRETKNGFTFSSFNILFFQPLTN